MGNDFLWVGKVALRQNGKLTKWLSTAAKPCLLKATIDDHFLSFQRDFKFPNPRGISLNSFRLRLLEILINVIQTFYKRFIWNLYEFCMKFLWTSCELCKEFLQTLYRLFTNFAWILYNLYKKFLQTLQKLCMNIVQNSYEICKNFIYKLCKKYLFTSNRLNITVINIQWT